MAFFSLNEKTALMKLVKHIKNSSLVFLLTAGVFLNFDPANLFAQGSQLTTSQLLGQLNTITTAVPFLLITPDSHSGAMGDAGVATAPDANSMHWNPSKYAFVKKQTGISVSYTPWLRALVPDINLAYLSGYYKMKKNGVLAASLRYFSLGDITFTDVVGNTIGQFRPSEFALDAGYATKLGDHFSGGGAVRYIYSNLTGGTVVQNSQTHAGQTVAADISGFYESEEKTISGKKSIIRVGINVSNIGGKISYSNTGENDFIPINLKLGTSLHMQLDDYNEVMFTVDANKLLVPSPPIYDTVNGHVVVVKGEDPKRGVVSGIFGSFSDAPGGWQEEMNEINLGGGMEYWYAKQFALRAGYFYEAATKGNRKYITVGIGLKYTVFGLDFAYLIPTTQRNPLQNTLRFSLLFDFDAFSNKDNSNPDDKK